MSPNESISCTDELVCYLFCVYMMDWPASPLLGLISSPCMLCTACWLHSIWRESLSHQCIRVLRGGRALGLCVGWEPELRVRPVVRWDYHRRDPWERLWESVRSLVGMASLRRHAGWSESLYIQRIGDWEEGMIKDPSIIHLGWESEVCSALFLV